jgi:hypothetical protein
MTTYELVRFGCGGEKPCRFGCGTSRSCTRLAPGDLDDAIQLARELIEEDPLNVIEIREAGQFRCTVGQGWISRRKAPKPAPAPRSRGFAGLFSGAQASRHN